MDAIKEILPLISVAAACVSTFTTLTLRATIAELRTEIAKDRARDKEELKTWINGSYMRANEVRIVLDDLERRIEDLE